MDVARIEQAEKSLDEFINTRSRAKKKANALANELAQAERARLDRRRQENTKAWAEHYLGMATSHARLAADYEERAMRLLGTEKREEENST